MVPNSIYQKVVGSSAMLLAHDVLATELQLPLLIVGAEEEDDTGGGCRAKRLANLAAAFQHQCPHGLSHFGFQHLSHFPCSIVDGAGASTGHFPPVNAGIL